jgi:hypothetical protein
MGEYVDREQVDKDAGGVVINDIRRGGREVLGDGGGARTRQIWGGGVYSRFLIYCGTVT